MPDDECACGLKYKTGGQVVAAVQMILGLSLIITGFASANYDCSRYTVHTDEYDKYYDCMNGNWLCWVVIFGGCFSIITASFLFHGAKSTRPHYLTAYIIFGVIITINYLCAAVLAICNEMQAIFVVLLFITAFWFVCTIVFVFKYRTIMISLLPPTTIILATPYVRGGQYPEAPAQVVISAGVQPGVYPAPYNSAPPPYPGNTNPADSNPRNFSHPPPYNPHHHHHDSLNPTNLVH